jgi:hypothetical protein
LRRLARDALSPAGHPAGPRTRRTVPPAPPPRSVRPRLRSAPDARAGRWTKSVSLRGRPGWRASMARRLGRTGAAAAGRWRSSRSPPPGTAQ